MKVNTSINKIRVNLFKPSSTHPDDKLLLLHPHALIIPYLMIDFSDNRRFLDSCLLIHFRTTYEKNLERCGR
ncbi:MAG: hypothetical protein A4E66_01896 [Syntrophus sp. PtaB.Bin001]|nr:MAG: hypothetical protein A4E66_01896 [Syntrophus sp. PtaB.Bin001]